jgi:hypothetical protein
MGLHQPVKDGIYLRRVHPIFAALMVAVLSVCYGTIAQSRTHSPTRPSLDLEGKGALVPTSPTCGPDGLCPGTLTASLTGPPFQKLSLDMSVSVSQTASPDSCYLTTGSASITPNGNQSQVSFEGELCVTSFFTYVLRGTLHTIPENDCQSAPLMVSAGELIAYGAVHTSGPVPTPIPGGNPIPVNQQGGNAGAIISIIGSTGQIPAPCPSP